MKLLTISECTNFIFEKDVYPLYIYSIKNNNKKKKIDLRNLVMKKNNNLTETNDTGLNWIYIWTE